MMLHYENDRQGGPGSYHLLHHLWSYFKTELYDCIGSGMIFETISVGREISYFLISKTVCIRLFCKEDNVFKKNIEGSTL